MKKKYYSVDLNKETDNEQLYEDLYQVIYDLTPADKLYVIGENEDCIAEYDVFLTNILGNDMLVAGMYGNGRECCEFFNQDEADDLIDWMLNNMCEEYLGEKYKLSFYKKE